MHVKKLSDTEEKTNKPSMSQFLAVTQNWGSAIPFIGVKNLIILTAVYNQNDITDNFNFSRQRLILKIK